MIQSAGEARDAIDKCLRRKTIPLVPEPCDEEISEGFRLGQQYLSALKGPEVTALVKYARHTDVCKEHREDKDSGCIDCCCGYDEALYQYREATKP